MALQIIHTSFLITAAITMLFYMSTAASDVMFMNCTGVVTLMANESEGSLVSPSFLTKPPSKVDCGVHITTGSNSTMVAVELLFFDLPGTQSNCSSDYIEFYDGASTNSSKIGLWCGHKDYGTLSSTNSDLMIVFHSDWLQNDTVFFLNYRAMQKPSEPIAPCTNVSLIANETSQFLLSPNYPNWYSSNTDCEWHITADSESKVVWLTLTDLTLEMYRPNCTHDYVKIYYGPSAALDDFQLLCGNMNYMFYISTNSSMTIVFHSDEQNNFKGFNFTYSSYKKPSDNSPDNTVLILVCIAGGLCLISFIVSTITCIKKRVKRQQLRNMHILGQNSSEEKINTGYRTLENSPVSTSHVSDESSEKK